MTNPKKVFIIEDDIDLVEAMKAILEARGIQVQAAYQPDDGLELIRQENPDLIILDVMFGKEGSTLGFDFARELRQDKALCHIPILMETAVNAEYPGFTFSPKDGAYLPVDDFINKPARPDELVEKVEKLLEAGASRLVENLYN
ncbi:response regulator transcription factor [candidate division KSB1 bacterium]|nr:response regulator transcription factor [candidate division KSB1 bacterium]